ncbi:glucuronate isomerase [Saccharicrinis sp. FJH54]|uniref:glucuronate isomerase n=1 Tax=Saccharicrinis sp. FJH54 TaxID=3344665 RepID=UPI0035D4674C
MKPFLDKDFVLNSDAAKKLYHDFAVQMPIIDYHCHLSPQQIAENKKFKTITEAWLYGDHYKWRAMRTFGVDEHYITGEASDWEKFEKWAEVVPYTLRNPLYHWTHLELRRYFGIEDLLSPATARSIYDRCNEMLNSDDYRVQGLLKKMNVEIVCTTDDPIDDLNFHTQHKSSGAELKMIPAWRPDKAMAIETEQFNAYLDKLEKVSGVKISAFKHLIEAIEVRHQFFHDNGCRLSDHGIEEFYAEDYTKDEIKDIFKKARKGGEVSHKEVLKFKSAMLYEFAKMDHAKGWVQQFHYGVIRNNNSRMFAKMGPDTGWDSIGQFNVAKNMQLFFDKLDQEDKLTKTILYNINPSDNEVIGTMIGNFNDGSVAGKMQFGSGWWFLDQKDGMTKQMNALSTLGLLSKFVGMLTDSRSFLSYPRHEYFRRILCDLMGTDMENGEIPADFDLVGGIVQDICYNNAKAYFPFAHD